MLVSCALLLGLSWEMALMAALGLSLSSTALAMATLEERGILETRAGSAGLTILLFQDFAAIPMIAAVPLLGAATLQTGASMVPSAWVVLKAVAVILGLVIGGR